jgi:hypothetical protein
MDEIDKTSGFQPRPHSNKKDLLAGRREREASLFWRENLFLFLE